MKKTILTTLFLMTLSAISFGAYEYFRKPLNLKNAAPDISISSYDLSKQMATDQDAMKKFGHSVIVVQGEISSVAKEKTTTVILDSNVRCELDQNCNAIPSKGKIRLKGILAGYDDLFGEVLLVKCQIDE